MGEGAVLYAFDLAGCLDLKVDAGDRVLGVGVFAQRLRDVRDVVRVSRFVRTGDVDCRLGSRIVERDDRLREEAQLALDRIGDRDVTAFVERQSLRTG